MITGVLCLISFRGYYNHGREDLVTPILQRKQLRLAQRDKDPRAIADELGSEPRCV